MVSGPLKCISSLEWINVLYGKSGNDRGLFCKQTQETTPTVLFLFRLSATIWQHGSHVAIGILISCVIEVPGDGCGLLFRTVVIVEIF